MAGKKGSRKAATAPAAAGHNSGVMLAENFHNPYEALAAAQSLAKEAAGKKSAAFKAFEEAGGNKKAIRLAMQLKHLSPYEQKKFIADALRYARYMDLPVGTQMSMDQIDAIAADVSAAADKAADEGETDGEGDGNSAPAGDDATVH